MASDSQPVDMFAQHVVVGTENPKTRNPITRFYALGFTGWAGFVGAEQIDGVPTAEWIKRSTQSSHSLTLADNCRGLSEALTAVWASDERHLSVFVAGYEENEPRFWFVSNGDVPGPGTTELPRTFEAVDDLGRTFQRGRATDETLGNFVSRSELSYRRGVLSAAAIFDSFSALVADVMRNDGHPEIPLVDSLDRYAAYVKFRFEFTKRMYDPKYGIGMDPYPPLYGDIHVFSVDPLGIVSDHHKHIRPTL